MDSENMQRISLYLDRGLVNRADRFAKEEGFSSRNEWFAQVFESLMADNDLQDNDILGEKLAGAVLKLSKYTPDQVEEMRWEAISNLRRTRGNARFEDVLAGYYDD